MRSSIMAGDGEFAIAARDELAKIIGPSVAEKELRREHGFVQQVEMAKIRIRMRRKEEKAVE